MLRGIVWQIALGAPFSRPFPNIDLWMHFGRLLAPFGSQMAPEWLPKNVVGSYLFAYFWLRFPNIDFWMHFGRHLAPFWLSFGSLLVPFGTLLLTPGLHFLTFGVSQRHFIYLLYLLNKNLTDIMILVQLPTKIQVSMHPNLQGHCRLPHAPLPLQST